MKLLNKIDQFLETDYEFFGKNLAGFDLITIFFTIVIGILAFIDLIFTYFDYNKTKAWEYTIGSLTFFIPIIVAILQWSYEQHRTCKVNPSNTFLNIFKK